MWDRFPNKMRQVMFRTLDRAGREGRDAATATDVLVTILSDPRSAGTFVVEHAGASPAKIVRGAVSERGTVGVPPASPRAARLAPDALHVLDVAIGESRQF